MYCRLCGEATLPFPAQGSRYQSCRSCGYVQLDERYLPTREAEQARYLLHHNSADDEGYRRFIMDFLNVAAPCIKPGGTVLDFGSGPQPIPAGLLSALGFAVTIYDPIFAPDEGWKLHDWDGVMVHEVAEHLAQPGVIFDSIAASLRPGGVLCIRTRFLPDDPAQFSTWHYKTDPTHVGFFSARSASVLAHRLGLAAVLIEKPDRLIFKLDRPGNKTGLRPCR